MMTPEEYRAAREKSGMKPGEFARALGVDPRTGRRWASGQLPINQRTAMAIAALLKQGRK